MTRRAAWLVSSSAAFFAAGCFAVHEPTPPEPEEGPGAGSAPCGDNVGIACDSEPGDGQRLCFYPAGASDGVPAAEMVYRFETTSIGDDALRVALILSEWFVDNSYGERSSSGYRSDGHRFRDLERSDHAQFAILNADDVNVLEVKVDYLSEADDAPSGYRSLGVWGGDGAMVNGSGEHLLGVATSLDDNLNGRGCAFTESSPSLDECPDWENRVIYVTWISVDAFGPAGFGRPAMDHVHASPSRTDATLEVAPGPCP